MRGKEPLSRRPVNCTRHQRWQSINRINGLEIASPDRALEAYSRLRTSDHLTISVTRNGAPVNIDFNIR